MYEIVNKQELFTIQYIGICKSAYIKGYAKK